MKLKSRPIARAVLDLWEIAPENERTALLDAALELLEASGLSREIRMFPRMLKDEWQKRENILPATLETPEGHAREHASALTAMLKKVLGKNIQMEEKANKILIGGAKLSVGDDRYDRSIRAALEQFEEHVHASSLSSH